MAKPDPSALAKTPKPPDMSGVVLPVIPQATRATYSRVSASIQRQAESRGNPYSFGTFLDETTGQIIVETDAPADLVAQIIALPPNSSSDDGEAQASIIIWPGPVREQPGRVGDTPPS